MQQTPPPTTPPQLSPPKVTLHEEQTLRWLGAVFEADDQAAIILSVSRIETALEELLRAAFVDHAVAERVLGQNGAAGTLSARIDLAHAMGEISGWLASELHLLRKLRNDAAHTWDRVSLDEPPFSDRLSQLRSMGRALGMVGAPRAALGVVCVSIVSHLKNYAALRAHALPPVPSAIDIFSMSPQDRKRIVEDRVGPDGKWKIEVRDFDWSKPCDSASGWKEAQPTASNPKRGRNAPAKKGKAGTS